VGHQVGVMEKVKEESQQHHLQLCNCHTGHWSMLPLAQMLVKAIYLRWQKCIALVVGGSICKSCMLPLSLQGADGLTAGTVAIVNIVVENCSWLNVAEGVSQNGQFIWIQQPH